MRTIAVIVLLVTHLFGCLGDIPASAHTESGSQAQLQAAHYSAAGSTQEHRHTPPADGHAHPSCTELGTVQPSAAGPQLAVVTLGSADTEPAAPGVVAAEGRNGDTPATSGRETLLRICRWRP